MTNKRLDHRMILRLMFALSLIAVFTGIAKDFSLKRQAERTTPGFARQWLLEKNKRKDGWGNPFYYHEKQRILRSAGKDQIFHTSDDLLFSWIEPECPKRISQWLKTNPSFSDLLPGVHYLPEFQALEDETGRCKIWDLSGKDGLYGSKDDWHENFTLLF